MFTTASTTFVINTRTTTGFYPGLVLLCPKVPNQDHVSVTHLGMNASPAMYLYLNKILYTDYIRTSDHRPQYHFYLLSFTFLSCTSLSYICDSPFLLFLPFICLDLYVSSRNYYCIHKLQLHRFNFTKILLAQIQRIRWNS
jgi:hypothetical protein